jgi:hypothetical protein
MTAGQAGRSNLWSAAAGILGSRAATLPFDSALSASQPVPASFAQERLLMLSAFEPVPAVYNVALAWWVEGSLPPTLLQNAIDRCSEAHEALRVHFRVGNGTPEIRVSELQDARCRLQILQAKSKEQARELASEELAKEFDLSAGPLWRSILIRVDATTELLLLIFHQTIVDGTSLRLFARDFARLYQGGRLNAIDANPGCGVRKFAAWQRRAWQSGDVFATPEATFWRRVLDQPVRPLRLPTRCDGMRGGETGPVCQEEFRINRERADGLHQLARSARVSNFVTMLSALGILLQRLSGDGTTDVTVFVTSAARYRPELLRMVGLLANILPFRLDLSGDPTVGALLNRVHEFSTVAFANQALPFEHMLRWLRVDGAATPVQVQFLFNNSDIPELVLPGTGRLVPAHEVSTPMQKPPLVLELAEDRGGGYVGRWRARLDLFEVGVVRAINERWFGLLEELS